MITEPTVLVLGAGASAPYGLPVGKRLIQKIVDGLDGVDEAIRQGVHRSVRLHGLVEQLDWCGHPLVEIKAFRETLAEAKPRSIDVFLANWEEFIPIGKRAIAATLIVNEELDRLERVDEDSLPDAGKCTWYQYLWERMDESVEAFEQSELKIITFNYDRSLEYYLFGKLKAHFGLDAERAVELLERKPIVHVHGQLGSPLFPTDRQPKLFEPVSVWADRGYRYYSSEMTSAHVINASADQMAIIPEQNDGENIVEEARMMISEASILCFLGFAYHPENVRLLDVDERFSGKRLLGTGFRLGNDETRRKRNLFRARSGEDLETPGYHPREYGWRILIGDPRADTLRFLKDYPVFDR